MSTFAVFGMTMAWALSEARKKTPNNRPNPKTGGPPIELTLAEWMVKVERNAEHIMAGAKIRQRSPAFDAPQFARQFVDLARKSGRCRDLKIRAKAVLLNAKGEPLLHKKTNAPRIGWQDYNEAAVAKEDAAA